jgi:hypothetical protein
MIETRTTSDETRESPLPEIRTMFRDADEAAVKDIEQRYGDLIPAERLAEMRAHPTVFENRSDFSAEFAERFGEKPDEGTLGWSVGPFESARVSTADLGSVPEATYHERLHQAADQETAQAMGSGWHEGMTQAFTERATGQTHEGEDRAPYPEETARAKGVAEVTGWDAVERLYFAGEQSCLSGERFPLASAPLTESCERTDHGNRTCGNT